MTRAFLALATLLLATEARAEGGEIYLEPAASMQVMQLGYARPGSSASQVVETWTWMPRFSAMARYGISDDWRLGIGLAYGWNSQVNFDDFTIDESTGRLYAGLHELSLPLSVSYSLTRGYDWSGLFTAYAGASLFRWSELGLGDTSQAAGGVLPRYSVALKDTDQWDVLLGLAAELEFRPFNWLAFRAGPYVEHSRFSSTATTSFGFTLEPLFVFGLGPSL